MSSTQQTPSGLSREAAADGVRAMARRLVGGGWHPANVVAHGAALEAFAPASDEYRQMTRALGYPEFCRQLMAAAWAVRNEQRAAG
jgi:hypothetical protein